MKKASSSKVKNILINRNVQISRGRQTACRNHTFARLLVARYERIERNTADSGFGLFLNLLLGFGRSVPMSQNKAAFFNLFLELVIAVHCSDTAVAIIQCFLINIRLDFLKQVFYVFLDTVARAGFLSPAYRGASLPLYCSPSRGHP